MYIIAASTLFISLKKGISKKRCFSKVVTFSLTRVPPTPTRQRAASTNTHDALRNVSREYVFIAEGVRRRAPSRRRACPRDLKLPSLFASTTSLPHLCCRRHLRCRRCPMKVVGDHHRTPATAACTLCLRRRRPIRRRPTLRGPPPPPPSARRERPPSPPPQPQPPSKAQSCDRHRHPPQHRPSTSYPRAVEVAHRLHPALRRRQGGRCAFASRGQSRCRRASPYFSIRCQVWT